jgi:broad specificity phosphatase PhoE
MSASVPRTLYLIKHGKPEIQRAVAAHDWQLSDQGRAQAAALAERLASMSRPPAFVISSEEPKALQTGEVLGNRLAVPVVRVLGLHEQLRYSQPFFASDAEFERHIGQFFERASERVYGDETADAAHARFQNSVRIAAELTSGDVAIVAHGTVISLLVSRANRVDPLSIWRSLSFGEYYAVTWPGLKLI